MKTTKRTLGALLIAGCLSLQFAMASCEKDNDLKNDPKPPLSESGGLVTPIGEVEGVKHPKTIGEAGGELASSDGRITIEIPSGALSGEVQISLQPISNECPMGLGQGFRLMPHGQVFSKPVSITFKYDNGDLHGTFSDMFGIAYQTDKGIWMATAGCEVDTVAKTVSVKTTHFSDWSFITRLQLSPEMAIVKPGESVELFVKTTEHDPDELFIPIDGSDRALYIPKNLASSDIVQTWELAGAGTLSPSGSMATYKAPNEIPRTNPNAVSVKIKSGGKAVGILVSNIYVLREGVSVSIDAGPFKTYTSVGANLSSSISMIDAGTPDDNVKLIWQGTKPGSFGWTLSTVSFINSTYNSQIHSLYGTNPDISGGSLNVNEVMDVGGWVLGTFTVDPAGKFEITTPPKLSTVNVRGVFMVKRLR